MKIKINNYTFDKTAKTITFTDYTLIHLDSLLLITNTTSNVIIYNFADPLYGGTVTGKVLTLTYDTSSMANGDALQIFYDDGLVGASSENQTVLNDTVATNDKTHLLLQQIRDAIQMPVDYNEATNARNIGGAVTVSGSLTTLATLTNQTNIGGYSADSIAENNSYQDWGLSIRSLII